MIERNDFYANGQWMPTTSTTRIDVISAITEQPMGHVLEATPGDLDICVAAARGAFDDWSSTAPAERQRLIRTLVDELSRCTPEFVEVIAQEVGMPISSSPRPQVEGPISNLALFADLLDDFAFSENIDEHLVLREAIGVVGCITPWNYPINMIVSKVGAAFAAGCTVVLKPSEVAPLNAYIFAEAVHAAGFPPGVFNLVSGYGPTIGAAIASHPGIDKVSFTGSTAAGKAVGAAAMETVKQIGLELGGKSAFIVLDDADFAEAIPYGVRDCFKNSGQTCVALTRMLVPESRYQEAVDAIVDAAAAWEVGDPRVEGPHIGPVISEAQWIRIQEYIASAEREGARLLVGGQGRPEHLDVGYFIKPTVFADVTPDMTIAREEIFGPVLAVLSYRDDAEAIAIANDSPYGLAGGVWSGSRDRALDVAAQIRTGTVLINGGRFNYHLPLSGYKQSGIGRENGRYGLDEYLHTKSLSFG